MSLRLAPITRDQANAYVRDFHRHNKPVRAHRFALAAYDDGMLVGVVIVGNPIARALQDGLTAEVLRLCVADGARNACSFLYGAARRVWFSMGGKRIVTYTLQREGGASLRGAGWEEAARLRARTGKAWTNREGREDQPVVREPKVRWQATSE